MLRNSKTLLILGLSVMTLLLAGVGAAAAPHTFTVRGRVTYPDGRPAAGLELKLFALDPGEGVDEQNIVWKIPNMDNHTTWTDADGRYVMTNVIDYPQNPTHYYTVRVMESSHVWHGSVKFRLWTGKPEVAGDIHLEEATWVVVRLRTPDGKPFNGKRVLYFQVGRDLSTPAKGYQRFKEVTFVNGETGFRAVIRDKSAPLTRIAILDVPTEAAAHYAMDAKGLKKNAKSGRDGFALAHKDPKGRALDKELDLVPLGETVVEFTL